MNANNTTLNRRFSVAPMMECGRSHEKPFNLWRLGQGLAVIVVLLVVPALH
jgi:hypothetical protein